MFTSEHIGFFHIKNSFTRDFVKKYRANASKEDHSTASKHRRK
jgi:hypothetical protein